MPTLQLTDRAVLRLSGPDARNFLQNLLTQDVAGLDAAHPLHAGLLSPQGKTLFQLFLFADANDILLDVAATDAEPLARRLQMFRLRNQVEINAAPELAVWQSWDEASPHPSDPRLPAAGSRYVAPPAANPAPLAAWHAHRLRLGLADADEIGRDELLWLETNARELHGVSFAKGCYVGQENTARMHHRQRLRKRLLPLRVAAPLAIGAEVRADGRNVGHIRGAAHAGLQMALLRVADIGKPLQAEGTPVMPHMPIWLTIDAD